MSNLPLHLALLVTVLGAGGCAQTRMLRDSQASDPTLVSVRGTDQNLDAVLQGVITPNSPGSWVKNARWDEYLITLRNRSDSPVSLDGYVLRDASGLEWRAGTARRELIKATKASERQHRDLARDSRSSSKPKSRKHAVAAAATIGAPAIAGASAGGVAFGASASTLAAAGAAYGGIVFGLASAVDYGIQATRIGRELTRRSEGLRRELDASAESTGSVFFPRTQAPEAIRIDYTVDGRQAHMTLRMEQLLAD